MRCPLLTRWNALARLWALAGLRKGSFPKVSWCRKLFPGNLAVPPVWGSVFRGQHTLVQRQRLFLKLQRLLVAPEFAVRACQIVHAGGWVLTVLR